MNDRTMFKKTKQNRIYQDVVEQIQEAILEGKLKPGDKLPSQRSMVEMFQISRATLREALRVLEQKGFIDIKLGVNGGAIVRETNTDHVMDSLGLLIRQQMVSLNEIAEFREGVEGNVAALASKRATKREIAQLEKLLGEAAEHLQKGIENQDAFSDTDKEIHKKIAQICGNSIYLSVIRVIHDNIHYYFQKLPMKNLSELEENYNNLQEIVQAVSEGNSAKARSLTQKHIRRFHTLMIKEQNIRRS